ncbi:MAG: zinc ribbon domain-containing protein [Acidobacteriota bacterium]|nr:zinc ribbon domain-containing protein [Acidobacteriota bacterium]
MAETTVENLICQACGADVRPNALFCYHCGGSVAAEVVVALKDKKAVGNAQFRDVISEEKNGDKSERIKKTIVEQIEDQPILKPNVVEEPKLKSAATMRRRSKSFQPKRVEIIWEEHENAPNGWFIAAAIFLTLFAAGILYLAMLLK